MAETLIMCSSGTQTSINGALFTAIQLQAKGVDVAVEFGQEALVAFAEKVFTISTLLSTYTEKSLLSKLSFQAEPLFGITS